MLAVHLHARLTYMPARGGVIMCLLEFVVYSWPVSDVLLLHGDCGIYPCQQKLQRSRNNGSGNSSYYSARLYIHVSLYIAVQKVGRA